MLVYKTPCKNCLLSKDAIVSPQRRAEIIRSCKKDQTHFVCHVASIEGKNVCCKTFYDRFGHFSQMVRIAGRLGILTFVEQPDREKLRPYSP